MASFQFGHHVEHYLLTRSYSVLSQASRLLENTILGWKLPHLESGLHTCGACTSPSQLFLNASGNGKITQL